ncbi:hypothetical protein LWC08_14680 [Desulfobaculum bizertense]|uniref:hypothetical protein n=1 Tax=Desulfobaculum bizertense TaxID=376490 RepID=UPI001F1A9FBC|nr:hypothetical protein [Desulfobaculum bizertense]UIJ37921.1 hypothetical protein LWC08_14680 [Desulfobaculum bizertense]
MASNFFINRACKQKTRLAGLFFWLMLEVYGNQAVFGKKKLPERGELCYECSQFFEQQRLVFAQKNGYVCRIRAFPFG